MPYIEEADRTFIDPKVEHFHADEMTDGELNYAVTTLLVDSMPAVPGYADYQRIVGLLECIKLEFYRRAAAPYEDWKRDQRGDVGYR